MGKKTIISEVYGKITYYEDYWKLTEKKVFIIANRDNSFVVEIDVNYPLYEEFKLKLLPQGLMEHYSKNMQLLEIESANKIAESQQKLFNLCFEDKTLQICRNIEEAALRKREEILEGQTEESFAKIVGKEKAKRCFAAKTREEKLASLELKRMRIFKDCIEITCTCDWFKPSGGFSIFEDGSVEMLYVDNMSI